MRLEVLYILPVLRCLLDHVVQLLLSHADHRELTHLRVADHGRLFQELLLESREEMVLLV